MSKYPDKFRAPSIFHLFFRYKKTCGPVFSRRHQFLNRSVEYLRLSNKQQTFFNSHFFQSPESLAEPLFFSFQLCVFQSKDRRTSHESSRIIDHYNFFSIHFFCLTIVHQHGSRHFVARPHTTKLPLIEIYAVLLQSTINLYPISIPFGLLASQNERRTRLTN